MKFWNHALNAVPAFRELVRKYKVLRSHNLIDDRISSIELNKYLYMSACIGKKLGFIRSLKEQMCVDAEGGPVPWYTYPAIEQLGKWDFSNAEVFEYGCGNSTRWWANRAKSVVTIESSREWYEKILAAKVLPANVTPRLFPVEKSDPPDAILNYAQAIHEYGKFDVIVIDGPAWSRGRRLCAEAALAHLRDDGIIILDNSDWHPNTSRYLRESGLLEIDYCGIGPLNTHSETTTLFISSGFKVHPLQCDHPGPPVGGLMVCHD